MLHWITIDKIQDFLVENDIVFYMDWENWKIEIDLKQDDIRFNEHSQLTNQNNMTIWETIQEYNSTHTGSMLVLSWDKWWAKTCGKISREVTKARWDIWYTAHKNFYVWEGYWIWKVILNK